MPTQANMTRNEFINQFESPQRELAIHYLAQAQKLGFEASFAVSSATLRTERHDGTELRFSWFIVPKPKRCPKGEFQLYLKEFRATEKPGMAREALLKCAGVREAGKHTLTVDLDSPNLDYAYPALDVLLGIAGSHPE